MNAVQAFLDQYAFPWRNSLRKLTVRYGVTAHPIFQWDVIQIEEGQIPFPNMIAPIHTNAFRVTSGEPADVFSTQVWVSDDPRENLRVAEEFVTQHLGQAEHTGEGVAREFTRRWAHGPATVTLNAFPDALRPYPMTNPAHEREPRLQTACAITISPGFRRRATETELIWLRTAHSQLPLYGEQVAHDRAALDRARPSLLDSEFARDPVPECDRLLGSVAVSGDGNGDGEGNADCGEAVIVCGRALLVIPMQRILRIEVDKLSPARGSGGSRAKLICDDPVSDSGEKSIDLSQGSRPDSLDAFARHLAALISKPVVLHDPVDDA